ncbi:MAG: polysaccharide pyruvyl transferase family protein [Anaerostipes sp.]|uniref:polysaccharide pyruvyl transferase family protein n=1 Tax=Anaerostipes sp. TaxID=1872530 RepID=UPI0039925F0D
MKTATLTFHAPNNNGSFLQAYALQQVLTKCLGVENDIIDYCTDKQIHQYSVFRKPHSMGDIVRNFISMMHYAPLKKRYNRFEVMRKTYLKMTRRCKEPEEVYCIAGTYDVLICGSDQIWNTAARDFSEAYFLPNVRTKKITYAVSCGSHVNDVDANKIISQARVFSHLSVRENTGYDLLKSSGIENVEIVCDPTLLLKKKDYQHLYNHQRLIKKPYIFLYTINYGDEVLELAAYLSKKYAMPVYTPFTGYSAMKCRKYGIKVLYDVAPDRFLNLLDNAAYTCSNSFHGIAFSIILEKQFFRPCKLNESRQIIRDDRIDGLLDILHLNDRRIYKDGGVLLPTNIISYDEVEKQLDVIRNRALNYLKYALDE